MFRKSKPTDEQIESLFKEYDTDQDGFISHDDLKKAIQKMGKTVSDAEIKTMISIADLDGDKAVNLQDFRTFVNLSHTWMSSIENPQGISYLQLNPQVQNALKTLTAGGIAGAVSRTAVSPLERLKILFQTQVRVPGEKPKYTSVAQSLRTIISEEGIRGCFKGNFTNCVRIFPTSAIQFFSYEQFKKIIPLNEGQKELTPLQRLFAGGLAGITALVITYPLDFIRARLTIQIDNQYKGIVDGMRSVARQEGVLTLYKGLWPSIVGVVPYVGIDFALYDTLKRLAPKRSDGTLSTATTLSCGAIAGTVGQTVAYPLDVIRRRLQVQGFLKQNLPDDQKYTGMWDATKKIWKVEGFPGFFRGLWPNYLKVVPAISISFFVYDTIKHHWKIQSTPK